MPVPSVVTMTSPRAALRRAVPHLREAGGVRVVDDVDVAAGGLGEELVGVLADPVLVDVGGRVDHAVPHDARDGHPDRPVGVVERRSSATKTFATASGVAGCGVSMRTRSSANSPCCRSTGAPLMPVPPKSMPNGRPVPRCVRHAPISSRRGRGGNSRTLASAGLQTVWSCKPSEEVRR